MSENKRHIEVKREKQQKQFDIWDALLPDGFEDAKIVENLTGKAPERPSGMPPRGRSSID